MGREKTDEMNNEGAKSPSIGGWIKSLVTSDKKKDANPKPTVRETIRDTVRDRGNTDKYER